MSLRLCFICGVLLVIPSLLSAQDKKSLWQNLNQLKAGQRIEVIGLRLRSHKGEFVNVTDEALTLQEHGTDVTMGREEVVRVSRGSGYRRGEHALIGLVVGGGIGAGVGAACGSAHGFLGGSSRGITALLGIVIGAPVGAAIGAVVPAPSVIYRAPAVRH